MFCQVNLLIPLSSPNIESIFLEALALEGALRPEAPAATFSQGEAGAERAAQCTPVLQGPFLLAAQRPALLAGAEEGSSLGSTSARCHIPHMTGVHSPPWAFFP